MGLLNLTWQAWLAGLEAGANVPIGRLPDTFLALRVGLSMILGASLTIAIWVGLRLAFPPTSLEAAAAELR